MNAPVLSLAQDLRAPIFIGGAPRSGTTLLRAIINASGKIDCGPEARIVPALCSIASQIETARMDVLKADYGLTETEFRASFARAITSFLAPRAARAGRIAEKTPANALHFPQLRHLFPTSPLVTIIRDPRDVVASLMAMDWTGPAGEPLDIVRDPEAAARLWVASVETALTLRSDPGFHLVRYEDLVSAPRREITRLFQFFDEPGGVEAALRHHQNFDADDGMNETSAARASRPIDRVACGRWRRDLTAQQCAVVEKIAGPLMHQLGYA